MAIIANTVTENGDVLFIKSDIAAVGLLALTGFTDSTVNENYPYLYFEKTFRYSLDGITWSNWTNLTIGNITTIIVDPYATFFIEYRYERKGVLGLENLAFNSATLDATYDAQSCGYYFTNSIFSNFFSCQDTELLGWYLNVTEKLFNTGVLAQYLPRFNENGSPEDFIIFWKSISKFFAHYVVYSRKFQHFYQNEELIREYLLQKGLHVSNNDDLMTLNTLMSQYMYEISKRGTINVYDKDSAIKGEILRLIFFEEFDEFVFNFYSPENFGWTLNRSSPLYRGLDLEENANKFRVNSPLNSTRYQIIQSGGSTITLETLEGKEVVKIVGDGTNEAGFLYNESNANTCIPVSNTIDYELSFSLKSADTFSLKVGFTSTDKELNPIDLKGISTDTDSNICSTLGPISPSNTWIKYRFLLLNKDATEANYTSLPNINEGENLKMTANVSYIIPTITTSVGTVYLKDIMFTPADTEYSRGFLNVKNYISMWVKNRNTKYNTEELEDYVRRFMIPYNSNIKITEL